MGLFCNCNCNRVLCVRGWSERAGVARGSMTIVKSYCCVYRSLVSKKRKFDGLIKYNTSTKIARLYDDEGTEIDEASVPPAKVCEGSEISFNGFNVDVCSERQPQDGCSGGVSSSSAPERAPPKPQPRRFVAPVSKALACGDVGVGALADVDDVAAAARTALGL